MDFSDDNIKLIVGGMGAVGALLVALLTAVVARSVARRDRRREMYGQAYRAALEWREMVYRVRRRKADDPTADQALVDRFHELQERILFYEGWIGSESKYMQRSYRKLVNSVRVAAKPLLQEAWDTRAVAKPTNAAADDADPNIDEACRKFLRDVRAQLSLQPGRRVAMTCRNWSEVK